ncbi:unnamed protein product [Zymoseptoria tritici ST99CH_3D7]|uniref:Uncharacterized protein n=1 Tax=Zymoseptoria tritici (strain ST99CH_3D7) TaxID=1276538 RepID=A0A1X7RCA5_ZYMT9|nr:unnamed protein product [Zymoseptoria tritici ST99CH_3D7]
MQLNFLSVLALAGLLHIGRVVAARDQCSSKKCNNSPHVECYCYGTGEYGTVSERGACGTYGDTCYT